MASKTNVLLFPSKYKNHFSTTFILDNHIDSDLEKFIYPLNLIENVLFLSKYSIRDNFITSNNCYANLYSHLSTIFIIFIYLLIILLDKGIRTFPPTVLALCIINYICVIIGRVVYNLTNNCLSDSHVNLIISIQRIQKTIKINYKIFTLYNWVFFFIIVSYYIILFSIQCYAKRGTPYILFSYIIMLIDDFNSLYLMSINKLLVEYTILFEYKLKSTNIFDVSAINSCMIREDWLDTMVQAFLEMSKATIAYKHISEIPIFYNSIYMAVYTLIYVELIIAYHSLPNNMFWILLIFWIIKNTCQFGMTCYNSELLKLMVKNIQATVLDNTTNEINKDINSKYESLLIDIAFSYEKMTTSVVLTVDATLPLTLLSGYATYIVVLLQFEFL
nr:gustatory receptor 30 [Papilio xuthus]